jgi:pilus assembly protein Flp/PilA
MEAVKRYFVEPIAALSEESGQALVEYGLIISLVALVVVGVLAFVGTDVSTVFSQIAAKL